MVATNSTAYQGGWQSTRLVTPEYTLEKVKQIIESGSIEERIKLSQHFFRTNSFYQRIILTYASMLTYDGVLIPTPLNGTNLKDKNLKRAYYKALNYVDKLDIKNLLTNITTKVLVDGCYYGVILVADNENFVYLDLPTTYCRTRFKDFYGNDIIEFNITFFDTIADKVTRENTLKMYPKVLSDAYRDYKSGKRKEKWVAIGGNIGMCFYITSMGVPPFLSCIPAALLYDETVDTEVERDHEEIKKIIVQKIPHNATTDALVFEPDEAKVMHDGAVNMMKNNHNVSVLTTYADVDAIVSKTGADTVNNSIEKMVENIYYQAGVSRQLLSATGNSSVPISIKNDTALMMILGNKYSRFLTNIIDDACANSNISFKYTILPIKNYYNDEYVDNSFKLAQSGYSFLLPAIALGINQRDLSNLKDLENDVLKLREKLIPLMSSYTQSGEVGAPAKKEDEKSDKTIANEESADRQGGTD